jgi:adenylate kinase family enzyme
VKVEDVIGKRVLILGEVGSGKTLLARRLLKELMLLFNPEEITVIDLAPQRIGEAGGKLSEYVNSINKVRYLSPERVYTPRLTGTSRGQVLKFAEMNRKAMEPLFSEFLRRITKILILNDVTLYLHAGKLETVLKCMRQAETFIATAYHGSRLAEDRGSGISVREKQLVKKLATHMDQIIEIKQNRKNWNVHKKSTLLMTNN